MTLPNSFDHNIAVTEHVHWHSIWILIHCASITASGLLLDDSLPLLIFWDTFIFGAVQLSHDVAMLSDGDIDLYAGHQANRLLVQIRQSTEAE